MHHMDKFILLLIFVSACDKTPTDSNNDPFDNDLIGVWSTSLAISSTESVDGSWEFSADSVFIDWYGLLSFSASYSIDVTVIPNQIDMDFDVSTPFHADPVPGIFNFIDQKSLVISVSNSTDGNGVSTRPINFDITENNENYVFAFTQEE